MSFDDDDPDQIQTIAREISDKENEIIASEKTQTKMLRVKKQTFNPVVRRGDRDREKHDEISQIVDIGIRQELERKLDDFANNIYTFAQELNKRKITIKQQFDSLVTEAKEKNIPSEILSKMMRIALHKKGVSESYIRKIMPDELKKTIHTNIRYLNKQTTYETIATNQLGKNVEAIPLSSDAIIREDDNEVQQFQAIRGEINPIGRVEPYDSLTEIPQTPTDLSEHVSIHTPTGMQKVDYMDLHGRFYKQNSESGRLEPLELSPTDSLKTATNELLVKTRQINNLETQIAELKLELKDLKHFLKDDSFIGTAYLTLRGNDVPVKVTVNIKEKKIERIEIDNDAIKTAQMSQ